MLSEPIKASEERNGTLKLLARSKELISVIWSKSNSIRYVIGGPRKNDDEVECESEAVLDCLNSQIRSLNRIIEILIEIEGYL